MLEREEPRRTAQPVPRPDAGPRAPTDFALNAVGTVLLRSARALLRRPFSLLSGGVFLQLGVWISAVLLLLPAPLFARPFAQLAYLDLRAQGLAPPRPVRAVAAFSIYLLGATSVVLAATTAGFWVGSWSGSATFSLVGASLGLFGGGIAWSPFSLAPLEMMFGDQSPGRAIARAAARLRTCPRMLQHLGVATALQVLPLPVALGVAAAGVPSAATLAVLALLAALTFPLGHGLWLGLVELHPGPAWPTIARGDGAGDDGAGSDPVELGAVGRRRLERVSSMGPVVGRLGRLALVLHVVATMALALTMGALIAPSASAPGAVAGQPLGAIELSVGPSGPQAEPASGERRSLAVPGTTLDIVVTPVHVLVRAADGGGMGHVPLPAGQGPIDRVELLSAAPSGSEGDPQVRARFALVLRSGANASHLYFDSEGVRTDDDLPQRFASRIASVHVLAGLALLALAAGLALRAGREAQLDPQASAS